MTAGLLSITLPADLAPAQRQAVAQLLETVDLAPEHPDPFEGGGLAHRCWFCRRRGGKLGGHHLTSDRLVWTHRRCHRRAHRSGRA